MRRPKYGTPFRRLLVPLDPGSAGRAHLELLADLAAWFESPMTGLFIEDEDLLSFADLPIAREVSLGGAVLRDFTRQHVQSHYRAQASLARRNLEAVAAERRIACRFLLKRGHSEMEIHAASEKSDLVVAPANLGMVTRPPSHGLLQRLLAGPAGGLLALPSRIAGVAPGPLGAVYLDTAAGQQALRVAGWVAARSSRALYLISAAGLGEVGEIAEETLDLVRPGQVARVIEPHEGRTLAQCLELELPALSLIVLPIDLPQEDRLALSRLGAPLLFVRPPAP